MKRAHATPARCQLKNEWGTPLEAFRYWNSIYRFRGDVAASEKNHLLENYITREENALTVNWSLRFGPESGEPIVSRTDLHSPGFALVYNNNKKEEEQEEQEEDYSTNKSNYTVPFAWLNPPFKCDEAGGAMLEDWIKKAIVECERGLGIVMLLPYQGALYWEELVFKAASHVFFVPGRLAFRDPETGKTENNCAFGCAIVVYDPRREPGKEAQLRWISQREMGIRKRQSR